MEGDFKATGEGDFKTTVEGDFKATGEGDVGRPGRLARKQGLQRPRREPELRLKKSSYGVMKHGPGLRVISLGCAARASLVNTINRRTYKQ